MTGFIRMWKMVRLGSVLTLCAVIFPSLALARTDALTAGVNTEDADRFVAVFEAAEGKPAAADLQEGYLEPGSRAIEIFTPQRIQNAEHLAAVISKNPQIYRRAIDVCLPAAKEASGDLRAIYLAFEGLLDEPDLPEVHAVFGANNSGGTAAPGAQVLGLEVLCRLADTEEELRRTLLTFFAHETVHALQPPENRDTLLKDPLLSAIMREGVADFVAFLVTGKIPGPERDAWAREREPFIWHEFAKDRAALKGKSVDEVLSARSPLRRWVANAGNAPEGWPDELGYWLGMRICMAYFEAAEDKRAAVRILLETQDFAPVLVKSGYAERFEARR
ncbi:MAG: DUF2268 domain-containing putative Zn-dependent protease [bacterium]